MKIWTCGNSPRSGSRNIWTRIKNFNVACRLNNIWNFFWRGSNDFLSRLVTMDETWLCHYDPPKESNNEWSEGIAAYPAPPKNFRVTKSLEMFSPEIFGIKKASTSLIIFQRAKVSTPSFTDVCWWNWRTFWCKKLLGKFTELFVFLHEIPCSPGTCNPQETGLTGLAFSLSPNIFSGSVPVELPPVPWIEKQLNMLLFFVQCGRHWCSRDLLGPTNFWNILVAFIS